MATQNASFISCGACGRKFEWKESLVGKPFKCACGNVVLSPARAAATVEPDDDYDLADEPPQANLINNPKIAPSPQLASAMTTVSAEIVRGRMGAIPAPKKVHVDPAAVKAAREMEKLAQINPVRDFVIPILLLAIGLALSVYDVMHSSPHPAASVPQAVPLVIGRAIGSMALMLGGIFLAISCFEVSLIGTFQASILKLCAIAVAPSALYGICCYAIGDVGGSFVGVLAGVTAYAGLFYFLLKLDWKDTAVCVLITWILVSAVNYAIYKYQGAASDSWI